MPKFCLLIALAASALVCGCNKDIRANTEKIDSLTQKMFVLQQQQAQQLADMQKLLSGLPVQLNESQLEFFLKGQEKALFYQTNVLYLLVTVDKRIQAQFQEAAEARAVASQQALNYHTNETDLVLYSAAKVIAALNEQEEQLLTKVQADLRQTGSSLSNQLAQQARQLAADKSVENRLKAIEVSLAQLQRNLELLQAQLKTTNIPAAGTQ